jgi:hypothetical protein
LIIIDFIGLYNYSDRISFFTALLSTYVNDWTSSVVTSSLSNLNKFVEFIGVDIDMRKKEETVKRLEKFIKYYVHLNRIL